MSSQLLGGCTCGEVRYELLSPPMFVHACHCHLCQKQTGSAFVVHGLIETDRARLLTGTLRPTVVRTGSGGTQRMLGCAQCGVIVWSIFNDERWWLFVRMGTLDDAADLPPQAHMFTQSKLPWVIIPADVPAYREGFDFASVWSADSWARKQAAEQAYVLRQAEG